MKTSSAILISFYRSTNVSSSFYTLQHVLSHIFADEANIVVLALSHMRTHTIYLFIYLNKNIFLKDMMFHLKKMFCLFDLQNRTSEKNIRKARFDLIMLVIYI